MSESIRVGKLRLVVDNTTREKIGGPAPEWIRIFPDGEYPCEDATYITDATSRKKVIEYFSQRGNDLVIDYEHQTLTDEKAPAAGWITELEDRGIAGLWGKVEWTAEAKQYLESGEYRYDSPVFTFNKKTKRVEKLHHLALTNWPGSNNRTPLTEQQIAASVRARLTKQKREGGMNELMERLMYFLNLPLTCTNNDMRKSLTAMLDQIPANDEMCCAASDDTAEMKSVGDALGVSKKDAAATSAIVAQKAVLAELELPETATLPQVHAAIGVLKTDAAEAVQLRTENANLKKTAEKVEAKSEAEQLEQLITSNKSKLPPAKHAFIRGIAKKYGIAHATEVVKNMPEVKPDSTQAESAREHDEPEVTVTEKTRVVAGRTLEVDQESAIRLEKLHRIQAEPGGKFADMRAAKAELERREREAGVASRI